MSTFTPTLRLVLEPADVKELYSQNRTPESVGKSLNDFFTAQDFATPVTFSAAQVQVLEDNSYLTHFKALVVALFEVDGVTCLKLATGDVIEIKFHLSE